jgi:hypothetical protein
LTELGFEALDYLDGVIGGERHGIWDFTWVAHQRFAPLSYASLYVWSGADHMYTAQIWARLEGGRVEERSLVQQMVGLTDPADSDAHRMLVDALRLAATRAVQLTERVPPEYRDDINTEELRRAGRKADRVAAAGLGVEPRLPFGEVLELVDRVLTSDVERVWTNQDILRTLLESGYTTDRADVNTALSELTAADRVRRISRGRYTKRGLA